MAIFIRFSVMNFILVFRLDSFPLIEKSNCIHIETHTISSSSKWMWIVKLFVSFWHSAVQFVGNRLLEHKFQIVESWMQMAKMKNAEKTTTTNNNNGNLTLNTMILAISEIYCWIELKPEIENKKQNCEQNETPTSISRFAMRQAAVTAWQTKSPI